jgi:hypothetical protein
VSASTFGTDFHQHVCQPADLWAGCFGPERLWNGDGLARRQDGFVDEVLQPCEHENKSKIFFGSVDHLELSKCTTKERESCRECLL